MVLGPSVLVDEAVALQSVELADLTEQPFALDISLQHIPAGAGGLTAEGTRARQRSNSKTAGMCLVLITSNGDLLVYRSFQHLPDGAVAAAEAVGGAAGPGAVNGGAGGGAAGGKGERAKVESMSEGRKGMLGLRFKRVCHELMLRGEELWDDMFVDEMELGDPTR